MNDRVETGVWTSIAVDREYIGAYLDCGESGVEAYDADDVLLDVFADEDAASEAIFDYWDRKSRSNGGDASAAAPLNSQRAPHISDAWYGKHILYYDWECYSEANIKQSGALYYAAHPTTLPLLVCYAVDDGPVQSYRPGSGEPIPEVFFTAARDPNWIVATHNNLFDSAIEIYQAVPRFNWPLVPIERRVCTMALAQYHGYPGALEKIADRRKLAIRKDKAGKKLMQRITRPQRKPDGTWGYIEPTPDEWKRLTEYCKIDTDLVREVPRQFKPLPEIEQRLYQLDHKINHRGPYIDVPLAMQACELVKVEKASINARLCELTGGKVTAFTKIDDMREFVNARGHNMTKLDKRAVAAMLARDPDPVVREVLELRQAGANSAATKYDAVLKCIGPDQRIRGLLRIYGTITGRWSSTRFNIHNLPREDSKTAQAEIEAIRSGDLEQVRTFGPPLDVIAGAVRGLVIAPDGKLLLIGDFNMIEPRLISWYSEEAWRLENFREFDRTKNPLLDDYRVLGARMSGCPVDPKDEDARRLGKVAMLSFGYGGSVRTWRKHVPDDPRSDEEIKAQERDRFREIYPAHTEFMLALEQQALHCVASYQPVIGKRHSFAMDGDTLLLHLASGRALSYPNARIEIGKYGKDVVVYDDAHETDAQEMLYGAWLAHLISGTARDLLAHALLNLDAAGFEIVLHVHDEVVVEVDANKADLNLFKRRMLDAPDWADGLPLATKVRASDRYIKIDEPTSEPVSGAAFPAEQPAPVAPIDDTDSHKMGGERASEVPHPMLAAALDYAMREDWDVFPVPPGEKKSHKSAEYSNGAKWGRTKDLAEIRRDWQEWPDANIGIPTGKDNGFFVVEADTKEGHGVDGLAGMKQFEAEHGQLPDTRMAESPLGSIHRYFKHPGGDVEIKNSVSEIAAGVDVRGDGGMVIAPPSVRQVGTYRWLNDLPIADAPGWLIELIKKKPRTPRSSGDGQSTGRSSSAPTADAGELAAAMAVIPNGNSVEWTEWNNIGMALWRATDGSGEGLDLFDSWSQTWPCGYDAAYTAARWDGYEKCPPTEIGAGTIFYMADQVRPNWRREHEERVARRRAEQIKRNIEIGDDVAELAVPLILTPKEMIARLVWIGFSGAVVDRVTFRIRKKEQASSEYAASVYYPKEEAEEEEKEGEPKKPKAKTKKSKPIPCLTIWMQSTKRTTVDALAWAPGEPQFCRPPENFNNAQTAFNTWRGITQMPRSENWQVMAEPFVDHVAYLVPVESERQRFMQWLAHIVQHPEVLPHTAYLMVAEKTGIGRNWMASVLVRVLRGYVAAGVSLPELLDGGYNGRLSCKLLAIVDELREGPSGRRYERAQRVKSIITEDCRLINPKYGIQSIERNCCRWLMFSNFFDALPFDHTDRRVETITNPTGRKTASYYERVYNLLHDPSFIASVWWLLKTMDISSFKPGAHATMNEAKERALSEMMTDVDRAVHDFRDECVTGLASRKDIERAAYHFQAVNAAHLTHAITHAGMINTGRRVKDAYETRHPVVIVDAARWTVKEVNAASVGTLLNAMGKTVKKGPAG